jgi:penicillin-binding protein 2
LYFLEESGLLSDAVSGLRRDGYSRRNAEEAVEAEPLKYVSATDIVEYMTDEYGLLMTDPENGMRYYGDFEVDLLLKIRYGMIISGFSRANDYTFVKDLDMDTVTSILEWGLDGVWYSVSTERVYEYPGYASHILGQTGPIYAENWEYYKAQGYNMNATVGISGCELAFEEYLRGSDGVKIVVEDADGNVAQTARDATRQG